MKLIVWHSLKPPAKMALSHPTSNFQLLQKIKQKEQIILRQNIHPQDWKLFVIQLTIQRRWHCLIQQQPKKKRTGDPLAPLCSKLVLLELIFGDCTGETF